MSMQAHSIECAADARANGGTNECFAGERCGGYVERAVVAHHVVSEHEVEHYRCEQLGEGAQVPVTCSCGESWVGAHEFHTRPRAYGECGECDAARDHVVQVSITWRLSSGYEHKSSGYLTADVPITWLFDAGERARVGIIDVRVEGVTR